MTANIAVIGPGIVSDIGRAETFPLPIALPALQLFPMTAAGMGRDDDGCPARRIAQITGVDLPAVKTN